MPHPDVMNPADTGKANISRLCLTNRCEHGASLCKHNKDMWVTLLQLYETIDLVRLALICRTVKWELHSDFQSNDINGYKLNSTKGNTEVKKYLYKIKRSSANGSVHTVHSSKAARFLIFLFWHPANFLTSHAKKVKAALMILCQPANWDYI